MNQEQMALWNNLYVFILFLKFCLTFAFLEAAGADGSTGCCIKN